MWFFILSSVFILVVLWFLMVRKLSSGENPKFWTQIPEGYIVAIARGGDIVDVLTGNMPLVKDRELNLWTYDEISRMSEDEVRELGLCTQKKTVMSETIGAYWMGLWPWVRRFSYDFGWNEYDKDKKGPGYIIKPRSEPTTRFLVKGTYAFFFKEAETVDGFKVDTEVLITFYAKNIRVAWRLKNWLTTAESRIGGKFTDYFRTLTIENLRELQAESKGSTNLFSVLKGLNGRRGESDEFGNPGLIDLVGNEIVTASLLNFKVQGNEEEQRALALKKVAKIGAEAEVARARGESKATALRLKPLTKVKPELANSFLFREGLIGTRLTYLGLGSSGLVPALNIDREKTHESDESEGEKK